jgi:stage V sporulation protein R
VSFWIFLGALVSSDYALSELAFWDEKICEIAKSYGLDWYEIAYETINYHEMIGAMSYHGMPSHYSHWSYGKSFERTHFMYNTGNEGLPYELIINSNPSIAYLMLENPLYLQILIMAHCVGHSDFFKNNRTFKDTDADTVAMRFRAARNRIQSYIEDPSIGIEAVEKIIDACHTLQYQIDRRGRIRKNEKELRQKYSELIKNDTTGKWKNFDLEKVPLEPEYDILGFIAEYGRKLSNWERDIINIIHEESLYFMPQIRTKVMNEGWASFWHYKILHDLNLPDEYHIPFLKTHNLVLRPWGLKINPYHLGFEIFKRIEKDFGLDECFLARETCNDESFIRQYLSEDLARELNLFTYSKKSKGKSGDWTIDEIMDGEDSWVEIRKNLLTQIGGNMIPIIYVEEIKDNELILRHEHDGRDLELDYADRSVAMIRELWRDPVKLFTIIEEEDFEVS